jgi:hypothetical protein
VTAPLAPREAAAEVVAVRTSWADKSKLLVHLDILPGFHVNAHEASEALMATQLAINGDAPKIRWITYPEGRMQSPAFSQQAIRLYTGTVEIAVEFAEEPTAGTALHLAVSYQACNENACFPLVTKPFDAVVPFDVVAGS